MRLGLSLFIAAGLLAGNHLQAEDESIVFYVQLIRATNETKPPAPGCRPVGPKLTAAFQPVLKWKSYWELCCKEAKLTPGNAAHVRLSQGREVEIDLRTPNKRKVTSFQDGGRVDRTTSPAGTAMTITGGDRDPQNAWFIVVRRDKPSNPGI
jgi:hypothetical protein